jgi:hypothetical protein
MAYPKWKYRKHPDLGVFQSTLVASAEAEAEIGDTWSDDPAGTGFQVRPASQLHATHITDGEQLYEVVTDATGAPIEAVIASVTTGDIHG